MDYRDHPCNRDLTPEAKVELFRQMARIRRFEATALSNYVQCHMGGFLMLSTGQESIAVGVRSVMGPDDHSIAGSRSIGHALAAGLAMGPAMAELMGRTNGCCKGKGGMFSFYAPDHRFWGGHGVDGSHTPLAAGLAFALKQRGVRGAAVCFLGDGTANQGAYHEALNLAGLFDLPVVFVLENNGYAMGTSVTRSSRFRDCLARRAEGYDIAWDRCEDQDLYEVRARTVEALKRAYDESRPTVLEIETCRYYGFTVADAKNWKYRSREEIERQKAERDPLKLWRDRLEEEGLLSAEEAGEILEEVRKEAREAAEYALLGAIPDESVLTEDVYWEIDNGTVAGRSGRHFLND